LYELAVAIEAAAEREPYPRLAKLMQSIAIQQSGVWATTTSTHRSATAQAGFAPGV